ncbi:hypothetical protein E1B28_012236 [Marasmius oreades]|uniref:Uncharacterized protein n=1 Tax=Marasmius oreades TaxID=181124 RepID=A0A9P7UQK1_9AGAR|nr:uncharacterized protein E1B28_012236 [Marasmius oreades]KAG7088219.1 hypothetical protein E1B28_012236 [Marasmius oreades]
MGRSAKLHKRVKKSKCSKTSSSCASPGVPQARIQSQVQQAKKKTTLKEKSKAGFQISSKKDGENVLGDVDYVSLMMGGRRKAKEEALKLAAMEE